MSVGIFFITDRNGDGIRITDAHDSDGFISSKIPSVIMLPTVCVPYTDRINPSVKLYNGVVLYLLFLFNFLINPLPTSVYSIYKRLILDGFLKFWCFSLDFARMDTKLPLFFPYGCCRFLVRR